MVTRIETAASSSVTRSQGEALDEDYRSRLSEVQTVPVRELLSADTPRSGGEDLQHVRLLSSVETALPPVIVHRSTRRIVDGMHRLRAAMLRGDETISVRFFDGDEREAFVVAVKENITHGLPLSADDRAAAAVRIVRTYPHWSDRMIAKVAGLSARTVSGIRRTALPEDASPKARLGNDGRVRPLDSSTGRIRAAELLTKEPRASLRKVAEQAGISPGTVRDVRNRLERGEGPLPGLRRSVDARPASASRERPVTADIPLPDTAPESPPRRRSSLKTLIRDPSLRSREHGRLLLRMLSVNAQLTSIREQLVAVIPEHRISQVSQLARESAAAWTEFAERLERRTARPKA